MEKVLFRPQNILKPGNIILIANRMLYKINQSIVRHNEQTAYIAYELSRNRKFNSEKCNQRNLVLLSLFHTIGFFSNDIINQEYNPFDSSIDYFSQDKTIESKYMYSCYYLEYMTPLQRDSIAIETFTQDYDEIMKAAVYQTEYRSIIYLAARISDYLDNNPDQELPEDLHSLAKGKLDPEFVELFNKVNSDNHIVQSVRDNSYRSKINEYIQDIQMTDEEAIKFIKLLVYFLDFKSTSTLKHSIETACIAHSLSNRMNLSEDEMNILFTSAFLHDVGKIGIPQRILEYHGLLSPEQMNLMKSHINHSKSILKDLVDPKILETVCSHHEKLNGSGYPNHLTGDQLNTIQRILTISDITSALSQSRSYHVGLDKNATLSLLGKMTENGELDSEIYEILKANYDDILLEQATLQKLLQANFSSVLSKYNDYYYNQVHFSADDVIEETFKDLSDNFEELEGI